MKIKTRKLTQRLRRRLKKPIGILIKGPVEIGVKKLKKIVVNEKPPKLVGVGDVVVAGMAKQKVDADLYIVDFHVMRRPVKPVRLNVGKTFYAANPAGTITKEAWLTVKKALSRKGKAKLVIKGEEDLLVLPAVMNAPENSIIVYGQPDQGIVLVRVTKKKRSECRKIIGFMKG